MNVSNLELSFAQKINNSTSSLDVLTYSKVLSKLKTGVVNVVDEFSLLPSASASLVGEIYYTKKDEKHYTVKLSGSIYYWDGLFDPTRILYSWGSGYLLSGPTTSRSSPASASGLAANWKMISAANDGSHAGGIKSDGTLWTWGANTSGQLGDGTVVSKTSPVTTVGGGSNWCFISIGTNHSIGIKTDGTLWAWGLNTSGQLGDGTTTSRTSPVTVAGGGSTWCSASASNVSSAAIKTDGTLWTWGKNCGYFGQHGGALGDGTTTDRSSPVTTFGGGTTWCKVSMGSSPYFTDTASSAGIKTDGTLWTWGSNACGQLGDGTTNCKTSPSQVDSATTWKDVAVGTSAMLALKTDGTLWGWGENICGKLGTGTVTTVSTPTQNSGAGTTWCKISSPGLFSSAVKTDGTLWTWGCNASGQLGTGNTTSRSSPGTVVGGITTWVDVANLGGAVAYGISSS